MKVTFLFLLVCFFSCKNDNSVNYKLVKVDSLEIGNGGVAAKYFTDSIDSDKRMELRYWDNGNIMTKSYFYNNKKVGDWEFFSMDGKLQYIMKFKKNKLLKKINYDTLGNIINND